MSAQVDSLWPSEQKLQIPQLSFMDILLALLILLLVGESWFYWANGREAELLCSFPIKWIVFFFSKTGPRALALTF